MMHLLCKYWTPCAIVVTSTQRNVPRQGLGRCIRHKYDYGAIVLLDERFQHMSNQNGLSRWVGAT